MLKIKGAVVRDTIQWLLGAGIAVHEIGFREEPRWDALLFAGVLMGIPALIALLHLGSQDGNDQDPPIPGSPSSSASSSSSH